MFQNRCSTSTDMATSKSRKESYITNESTTISPVLRACESSDSTFERSHAASWERLRGLSAPDDWHCSASSSSPRTTCNTSAPDAWVNLYLCTVNKPGPGHGSRGPARGPVVGNVRVPSRSPSNLNASRAQPSLALLGSC